MSTFNKTYLLVSIVTVLLGQDSTKMINGKKIGPIFNDLPHLDSLIIVKKDSIKVRSNKTTIPLG